MSDTQTTEQTAYEKALDEIGKLRENVEKLKPHLEFLEKLKAAFPDLNLTVLCGYHSGTLQGALLFVNDLDDIRQVLPVGAALSAAGYTPKGHEDYPEIKRRTYSYEPGPIKMAAFLKWDGSAKCEFKVVGHKQEPVYELVCKEV